jgi:hypothetical protein
LGITTVGARVEHVSYQNATAVSGHIAPIFGLGMTDRGSGGNFVGGGGGTISSTTKEWCRFVARRGDRQTFSGQGGCELALRDGGPLFVSNARIGDRDREFLLYNPESRISQLKVTAGQLVELHDFDMRLLGLYLVAWVGMQLPSLGLKLFGLSVAAIPTWSLYRVWSSKRAFRATQEQIRQGMAIVHSDFEARGSAFHS